MTIRDNQGYGGLRGELSVLGYGFDFQGVLNLISKLEDLNLNHAFNELFYVFQDFKRPVSTSTSANKNLQYISPLLTQLISNDLTPENSNIFSGSIDYFSFYNFYLFLEWIYSMNLGRYLNEEDIEAIFSSNLMEKIILNLEGFKEGSKTKIEDDFFYYMREIKWTNKHVEGFLDKLHDLLMSKCFNEIGDREALFIRKLKINIKLLSVCCSMNDQRIYMTTSDIIDAYNVLFKIIESDITDLVNKKAYTGVLTCYGCNGYYHLQEDESPHDFDYCRCGNSLTYVKSLEELDYNQDYLK